MRRLFSAFCVTILRNVHLQLNWVGVGLVFIVGLNFCTTPCNECETTLKSNEFFPLQIGHYVEYDVSEDEVLLGRPAVTRQYQWKEIVAEKYQTSSNETVYRIERYRRTGEGQRWTPDSTSTIRLKIDHVVRNENGRDYVKMMFPLAEKRSWNGNIYNNLGEDEYSLKEVNKAFRLGQTSFERTATVVQQNDSTLVNQDKRIETYAVGVGLIYRERINVQFCSSTPSCVGKAQVDFGTRQFVRFRRAGVE